MRRSIVLVIASLLSLGVLFAFSSTPARADDLSPEEVEQVKTNCVSIKNSLNQLHASDALLRVNRGQIYESMASKLMERFNNRLEINNLDNLAMSAVTASYRQALTTFRLDYIAYEQKLSEAIRIDCVSQPNTFHQTVLKARELRADVHDDVRRLHQIIDDYRSAVGSFLVNYERLSQ